MFSRNTEESSYSLKVFFDLLSRLDRNSRDYMRRIFLTPFVYVFGGAFILFAKIVDLMSTGSGGFHDICVAVIEAEGIALFLLWIYNDSSAQRAWAAFFCMPLPKEEEPSIEFEVTMTPVAMASQMQSASTQAQNA